MVMVGLLFVGLTAATFFVALDHDVAQAFGLFDAALALFFLGDGGLSLWRRRRLRNLARPDNR